MTAKSVTITFSRDEAEGLAELLEMQWHDREGFLALAEDLRRPFENVPDDEQQ